ncbi:kinase-like domain-containing protein [Stachybotrys elegans]|uniref:Kinase-like domain-containing protein n=1 Tax=Stachybotrys elegans TaxID=80388 RepID=A0A8K0WKP0_9HYPO|nr:kinase-like domain-containing protein [Stachybotrys elegans]
MSNHIARHGLSRDRDELLQSINDEDILNLASSYHNGDPCEFFRSSARGSSNVCFFVSFNSGDRWVVRVPMQPCLSFDAKVKIDREVATMKILAERTTIPIPKVVAHSLSGRRRFGPPEYIILEYVEGTALTSESCGRMNHRLKLYLYQQLADMYAQLRRITFPAIGALGFGEGGSIEVVQGPVSCEYNMHALEGVTPSGAREFFGPEGIHTSATEYASSLLKMVRNRFEQSPASVTSETDSITKLYYLEQFESTVSSWVNPARDAKPFVLTHGNFKQKNIIVDEAMNIKAITNWQWSRVVPLQFFNPPRWLVTDRIKSMCWPATFDIHVTQLNLLRAALQEREQELYRRTRLYNEWSKIDRGGGLLVAAALEEIDLDAIIAIGADYQDHGKRPIARIEKFTSSNPGQRVIVAKKLQDKENYDEACKKQQLGEFVPRPPYKPKKRISEMQKETVDYWIRSPQFYERQREKERERRKALELEKAKEMEVEKENGNNAATDNPSAGWLKRTAAQMQESRENGEGSGLELSPMQDPQDTAEGRASRLPRLDFMMDSVSS